MPMSFVALQITAKEKVRMVGSFADSLTLQIVSPRVTSSDMPLRAGVQRLSMTLLSPRLALSLAAKP